MSAQLALEPIPRIFVPVPQEYVFRLQFDGKLQKLLPMSMRGQIEILDFTISHQFAMRIAVEKWLSRNGLSQPASRSVRIGVPYKKDPMPLIFHHPRRQLMRSGVFTQHSSCDDKNATSS